MGRGRAGGFCHLAGSGCIRHPRPLLASLEVITSGVGRKNFLSELPRCREPSASQGLKEQTLLLPVVLLQGEGGTGQAHAALSASAASLRDLEGDMEIAP